MVKISFTFVNVQGSLDALECKDQSTLAEIYNSVNQAVGNQYTASLSLDQVNILPNDNTPLNLSGEVLMYVQLTTQLSIIVYIDGAQVTDASISGSVTLENFVQQLLLNLNQKAFIQGYQILSQNQEVLASSPTINLQTPFQDYGQQQLLLYLTLQKPKDEEQLDSLVVLDGMSLTIDPEGEFVNFKLHKPILLSGQLKKQQGKQELNVDLNQNWITHGQISYANPNLQGLIVKWSDGTYSAVQFY